ncbi:MAG: hypothetical protein IPP74_03765 [Alphaproteobacteria bacterium]|nr:hypothetical protein [Alphaproteobacteria bacterium]
MRNKVGEGIKKGAMAVGRTGLEAAKNQGAAAEADWGWNHPAKEKGFRHKKLAIGAAGLAVFGICAIVLAMMVPFVAPYALPIGIACLVVGGVTLAGVTASHYGPHKARVGAKIRQERGADIDINKNLPSLSVNTLAKQLGFNEQDRDLLNRLPSDIVTLTPAQRENVVVGKLKHFSVVVDEDQPPKPYPSVDELAHPDAEVYYKGRRVADGVMRKILGVLPPEVVPPVRETMTIEVFKQSLALQDDMDSDAAKGQFKAAHDAGLFFQRRANGTMGEVNIGGDANAVWTGLRPLIRNGSLHMTIEPGNTELAKKVPSAGISTYMTSGARQADHLMAIV